MNSLMSPKEAAAKRKLDAFRRASWREINAFREASWKELRKLREDSVTEIMPFRSAQAPKRGAGLRADHPKDRQTPGC